MKKATKVLVSVLLAALVLGIVFSQTLGKESTVARNSGELHTLVSSGAQANSREFKVIDNNNGSRMEASESVNYLTN